MLMDLGRISAKPSDYKVCNHCNHLNWYENEECCSCYEKEFVIDKETVDFAIKEEYNFYKKELGLSEKEIDEEYIEV